MRDEADLEEETGQRGRSDSEGFLDGRDFLMESAFERLYEIN